MITLAQLNAAPATEWVTTLGGIFEHSPWVAERAMAGRPFASIAALHAAMCAEVETAGEAAQLQLIRAHPELASRAAIAGELTDASNREQGGAGLKSLTREQFGELTALNRDYGARFNFPFILAVKGHNPASIIEAVTTRIAHSPAQELRTALEQIGRIARFRLEDLIADDAGNEILARADELARFSDSADGLTCAYLTAAHQATAKCIRDYMLAAGLTAHIDDVGNVVGRLDSAQAGARALLTGSHYDTVSNAGRYDGRLGILLPVAVAARLKREGVHLPFHLEIVAFSEEEGLRFQSTFLGSSAVAGCFDAQLLERVDRAGTSMRAAMTATGHDPARIPAIARRRQDIIAFVEVHIEQGPVLLDTGLATGVVTGVAGSRRSLLEITGLAGHAGTVPMHLRRDAAAGAAEIVLLVEARCARDAGLVGTVGQLHVPGGAMNVIPGQCALSIDLRSVDDALRTRAAADIDAGIAAIGARRKLNIRQSVVLDVAAVPCTPRLQQQFAASIERITGVPARSLPSGAGHDTMMMARLTDAAMLFVRCGNDGISHHPAESLNQADARLAADVFRDFLLHYKAS